jgi:hypothetical protein
MSLVNHLIGQPSLPSELQLSQQKLENFNSIHCRLCVKTVFMLVPYRELVSLSDDF